MRLQNNRSYLIYIVTAGIFRLLLCKRSYTLYICILLFGFAGAQNLDLGLYRITDTLYNDTVFLNEEDVKYIQKKFGSNSVKSEIEFFKDSLYKDSVIQKIRTFPVNYESFHGGTYDYYYGTMNNGIYSRTHNYGSSVYEGRYNDDKYFKNGKIIAWIQSAYLPYQPNSRVGIHFYLFSAESVLDIVYENKRENAILLIQSTPVPIIINDTIIHNGNTGISIYDFIEHQKGLIIQDSTIKRIRMMNPFCMSEHGGTFDNYDCKTYLDKELIRHHSYGMSMGKYRHNDDKYYKDGKLIKWIKADELVSDSEEKYKVKIHIYEVSIE